MYTSNCLIMVYQYRDQLQMNKNGHSYAMLMVL